MEEPKLVLERSAESELHDSTWVFNNCLVRYFVSIKSYKQARGSSQHFSLSRKENPLCSAAVVPGNISCHEAQLR